MGRGWTLKQEKRKSVRGTEVLATKLAFLPLGLGGPRGGRPQGTCPLTPLFVRHPVKAGAEDDEVDGSNEPGYRMVVESGSWRQRCGWAGVESKQCLQSS